MMNLASFGLSSGATKFTNNEALHLRSSILKNYDDFVEGNEFFFLDSFSC